MLGINHGFTAWKFQYLLRKHSPVEPRPGPRQAQVLLSIQNGFRHVILDTRFGTVEANMLIKITVQTFNKSKKILCIEKTV